MRGDEEGRPREHVPFGQILFDNTFFLLFLGVAVPLIFYTVWGLLDIGSIPPLPTGASQVREIGGPSQPAPERHPGEGEKVGAIPPNAQRIGVVATDFAFAPARLTVRADRPVAVTVINKGAVPHDWALRTAAGEMVEGTMVDTEPGERRGTVFTLEPGTYEIYCTIPGHYEAGMKGQMVAK